MLAIVMGQALRCWMRLRHRLSATRSELSQELAVFFESRAKKNAPNLSGRQICSAADGFSYPVRSGCYFR